MKALLIATTLTLFSCGTTPTPIVINAGYTAEQWSTFVAAVWKPLSCEIHTSPALPTVADFQSVATSTAMVALYGANFASGANPAPLDSISQIAATAYLNSHCP